MWLWLFGTARNHSLCCLWQLKTKCNWSSLNARAPTCNQTKYRIYSHLFTESRCRYFLLRCVICTLDYHFNFTMFRSKQWTVNTLFFNVSYAFRGVCACVYSYLYFITFFYSVECVCSFLFVLSLVCYTNCHFLSNWMSHSWAIFIYLNKC